MKIKNLIELILDASHETVAGLKGVTAKMEFVLKVMAAVLAAGDVNVELEDGLRALAPEVEQAVAAIRARLAQP